jgi:hypothetical protein
LQSRSAAITPLTSKATIAGADSLAAGMLLLKVATISQQSVPVRNNGCYGPETILRKLPEESLYMGSKHRKPSQRAKRIALIGAASATATCLTVGAAPPPPARPAVSSVPVALAASTGPDYTALITSLSNSTNNILFAQGNFQGGLADLLAPLLAATGGTANAGTTQADLLDLHGILNTLDIVLTALTTPPNLTGVPGLPPGAGTAIAPVLTVANGVLGPALTTVRDLLTVVDGVLTGLDGVTVPLLGLLGGVPGLGDLLPGLTATLTSYNSNYNLPLLGLSGSTNALNLFAQVPGLTPLSLVDGILGALTVGGIKVLTLPLVPGLIDTLLTPLNVINTPTITAWVPTAGGTYNFPLGGSLGFLATMPTLDVGPVGIGSILPDVPPIVLSDTDTVLAVPILAGGVTLPLGLASFGAVGTPGIVLPTATGINTIGGVSVSSLSLLGGLFSYTNTNLQLANYYGTNGIDYSNGQNIGLLTTPFGAVPVTYSLGSFNFGTDGFGFAGPSLFGVGLLPPLQVGTAPSQQDPDGLLPASVLNVLHTGLRTAVPTQLTSVTQILGIPDVGDTLSDAILTPGYHVLVTPLATQYTSFVNQNIGSWTNGAASGLEQLTAAIADLSAQVPGATPIPPPAVVPAAAQSNALLQTSSTSNVVQKQAVVVEEKDAADPITHVQNQVRDANTQIKNSITTANAKTKAAVAKAKADLDKSVKKASDTLNKIAKEGEAQVKKTVDGAQKAVKDTVNHVSEAANASKEKAKAKAK